MGYNLANFPDFPTVGLTVVLADLGTESIQVHNRSSSVMVQAYRESSRLNNRRRRPEQLEVTSHTEKSGSSSKAFPLPSKEKIGAIVRGLLKSPVTFGIPDKEDCTVCTQDSKSSKLEDNSGKTVENVG